eukprot:SAG31_NODE_26056_length_449_cov_1.028571_1_plen_136_part_10
MKISANWIAYAAADSGAITLWYTSCRIGHVAPDAADEDTLHHALRWDRIKFQPSLRDPTRVAFYFPSTKTRPHRANRPWFTAVGRAHNSQFCLVSALRRHFMLNYIGVPSGFLFTRGFDDLRHLTRTGFTNVLQGR